MVDIYSIYKYLHNVTYSFDFCYIFDLDLDHKDVYVTYDDIRFMLNIRFMLHRIDLSDLCYIFTRHGSNQCVF